LIKMSSKKEKIKNDPRSNGKKNTDSGDISKDKDKDKDSVKKLSEDDTVSNDKEKINKKESQKIKDLNSQLEDFKEEKIRLLAEMENLRKRFEKEKTETIKFGNINFARDILSPGDNLERALASFPEDKNNSQSIKNLVEGLKMVQKEFSSILEKNSIKKIISINEKFDHNFHQAMMEIEREDIEEGIVVQEIQAGYTMHDRLLRPSMVAVSKKPDNLKKKDDNDESGQKNSENDKKTQENK
tara:strand:+ start:1525 stop:2250 length:726 start_codon:yes stop_codon:yes gene_type:complete